MKNVAVLREESGSGSDKKSSSTKDKSSVTANDGDDTNINVNDKRPLRQQRAANSRRREPIKDVKYDFLYHPLDNETQTDGKWELCNPVDSTTGLWYDRNPYTKGGTDWSDLIPTFLRHGYSSSLSLSTQSSNPLLLVERSYNPPPLRQQLLEILLEEMDVPAVYFGRDATLSCYACGRTTSTVVDIGYNGTIVTPVYDGYVEQKGIRRIPVGSKMMDELALRHLDALVKDKRVKPLYEVNYPKSPATARNVDFLNISRLEIAKESRVLGAGAAINAAASKSIQVPSISFTLPDGQAVDIPSSNRFGVAELVMGRSDQQQQHTGGGGGSGGDAAAGATMAAAAGTSGGGDSNDGGYKQYRDSAVESLRNDYSSLLLEHNEEIDDHDDDDDDSDDENKEGSGGGNNGNTKDKYTEATAVGISSRRSTRGSKSKRAKVSSKAPPPPSQQEQQQLKQQLQQQVVSSPPISRSFSNRHLQLACTSYLQAHNSEHITNSASIANMVCDAAFRCDRDQQASLLGNVVLGGGGACIGPTDQSVPDLLREQVESIIHTHTPGWRVKVLSPNIQERAICSWLGGSILGSLGTFHDMWITKAEYDEWGSSIVNRKCP